MHREDRTERARGKNTKLAKAQPTLANIWPTFAIIGKATANVNQPWPNFTKLDQVRPSAAKLGQALPSVRPTLATSFGQTYPAPITPNLSEIGHHRATFCPTSAATGPNRANCSEFWSPCLRSEAHERQVSGAERNDDNSGTLTKQSAQSPEWNAAKLVLWVLRRLGIRGAQVERKGFAARLR